MSITVVIPIGPSEANKRWHREAIESAIDQSESPVEVLLIDDGAMLQEGDYPDDWVRIIRMPWRTGISHAFNYGIMLAKTDLVFMLGSDDTLEPNCLERCWEAYNKRDRQDAYYSVPVRYMSTGEVQTIPCNAAMVTKGFWKMTGGFPIESAIGRGDNALLSICMNRPELPVVWVGHETGHPLDVLYNYREHPGQWTPYANRYAPELISIINKLTEDWTTPEWVENYNV
jgi:glycosyltransferase involved in cell wall biosynthesis